MKVEHLRVNARVRRARPYDELKNTVLTINGQDIDIHESCRPAEGDIVEITTPDGDLTIFVTDVHPANEIEGWGVWEGTLSGLLEGSNGIGCFSADPEQGWVTSSGSLPDGQMVPFPIFRMASAIAEDGPLPQETIKDILAIAGYVDDRGSQAMVIVQTEDGRLVLKSSHLLQDSDEILETIIDKPCLSLASLFANTLDSAVEDPS